MLQDLVESRFSISWVLGPSLRAVLDPSHPIPSVLLWGKDRTGLLACLLLSALGIDKAPPRWRLFWGYGIAPAASRLGRMICVFFEWVEALGNWCGSCFCIALKRCSVQCNVYICTYIYIYTYKSCALSQELFYIISTGVRLHMDSCCFNHHRWPDSPLYDNCKLRDSVSDWQFLIACECLCFLAENHFADTVSRFPFLFQLETGKTGSAETLLVSPQETIMGDYLKTNLAAEHINACVQASRRWGWNAKTF